MHFLTAKLLSMYVLYSAEIKVFETFENLLLVKINSRGSLRGVINSHALFLAIHLIFHVLYLFQNPGYMKDNFYIQLESMHLNDRGETENVSILNSNC